MDILHSILYKQGYSPQNKRKKKHQEKCELNPGINIVITILIPGFNSHFS